MKKTGILTFQETLNYGALLQGYALQSYISRNNCVCELIDYRCEAIYNREFPDSLSKVSGLKETAKYILGKKHRRLKAEGFRKFANKYMKLTSKKYNKENISELKDKYELYISGSDQVWNGILTGGDSSYFLDFVSDKNKKSSYAASFGYREIPEQYKQMTERNIKQFKNISVREIAGKKLIEEITGNEVPVVLDPTLLLNKEEWFEIVSHERLVKEKYILIYLPHDKKNVFDFAKKLSKRTGLKIYYMNITYIPQSGVKNLYSLSPEDFLNMIKNAEYVVTGSFHGVAFSINFEKQFYYEDTVASGKNGSRIESLVGIAGLRVRRICDEYSKTDIDYSEVKAALKEPIENSKRYIKGLIE